MWLRMKLLEIAYPRYACEDCIGMGQYGCYCSYYDAEAPCTPPRYLRKKLRDFLKLIGWGYKEFPSDFN